MRTTRVLVRAAVLNRVCVGLVFAGVAVGLAAAPLVRPNAYAAEAVAPAAVSTLGVLSNASATAILAHDVDGDGIDDLIVAYREEARAFIAAYLTRPGAIYAGRGQRLSLNTATALSPFSPPIILAELPLAVSVLSARDVDADGRAELLAETAAGLAVLAERQAPKGRFELRADLQLGARGLAESGPSLAERKIMRRLRRARTTAATIDRGSNVYTTASGTRGVYVPDLDRAAAVDANAARLSVPTGAGVLKVITMRLNGDAVDDLVVLRSISATPEIVVSVPAATFTVTTTSDTGDGSCDTSCTLREAIAAANATPELDTIAFDIPTGDAGYDSASGIWRMQPASELPAITAPVSLDASTQPGFAGTPLIELDGSLIPAPAIGFNILSPGCLVRGFSIHSFAASLTPLSNILVCGCAIALSFDQTGTGVVIEGNYIGVVADGTSAPGNGQSGIAVSATHNTIGGTTSQARNVISGHNQMAGVVVVGLSGNNNTIVGNYVGTDPNGATAMPNDVGILVSGDHNTIGAAAASARNLVSGNTTAGIEVRSAPPLQGAISNIIDGNYIGTEVTGMSAVANGIGVLLTDAVANEVGTTGVGNLVSGNTLGGIHLVVDKWSNAMLNVVRANSVGLDAGGGALGNGGHGIRIVNNSSCEIGGAGVGEGNTIANNGGDGVSVELDRDNEGTGGSPVARSNTIFSNSIHSNAGIGIDLDNEESVLDPSIVATPGVTANDGGADADVGANDLQNFPILSSATTTASDTTVTGTFEKIAGVAMNDVLLQFFASTQCDASGFGEGEIFLTQTVLSSSPDQFADAVIPFNVSVGQALVPGTFVTATASRKPTASALYSTSEFSACVEVTEKGPGTCGDGSVDTELGEQCDAGAVAWVSGAYCRDDCSTVACGDPDDSMGQPTATDALFLLSTAVGIVQCSLCLCDIDSTGAVTATDALQLLRVAVGLGGTLVCPTNC